MGKRHIIISGGGTGGHIFPALSIASAIREIRNDADILFVGAEGKMEMHRVPQAGFPIKGLPVAGLQRKITFKNLALPFKVCRSLTMAGEIIDSFKPDVAVGVGGYASAPLLWKAESKGIPCLIQEQNSYAGLANRILGRKASIICTAYEGMERFFPAEKIILTGNPIRKGIHPPTEAERKEAFSHFGLKEGLPVVVVVGGSLGCGTFNKLMRNFTVSEGLNSDFQILWQSGETGNEVNLQFFKGLEGAVCEGSFRRYGNVINTDFITRMDLAFAAADLMVSRAGAGTISELCTAGKPTIFVPSPNVTEDHQTHNAEALCNRNAALMVRDDEAGAKLMPLVRATVREKAKMEELKSNILKLAKPEAAKEIAEHVLRLADSKK